MARRSATIFINGKEVANEIKQIAKEKRKLNAVIQNTIRGSEDYEAAVKEYSKLNGIITEHRKNLRGVESSYDKMKAGVGKFIGFAAAAFTADAIIGYGKELFKLGAEMEIMGKKAKTVFGEALPLVTQMAKENAAAMGLTTGQYVDAATAIGDLLIPMGFQREEAANISGELVNLSGALSEWTAGQFTSAEVSTKLSKALLGEREELKALGISISEADVKARLAEKGLDKLTGTMLQQAKATATLELITEKSTDAQAAFADGAGTLTRRQAEISAKISEVSEKLATVLFPVFERLVDIAGGVADVLVGVASAFGALANPVTAANDAFNQQQVEVKNLEKNLVPLLERYDELKSQSELSKEEQDELKTVIGQIGGIVPTAITAFDEYGNALDISTGKTQEFIDAQKLLLQQRNKEAIEENTDALDDYNQRLAKIQENLSKRNEDGDIVRVTNTIRKSGGEYETFAKEVKLSADEIRALQEEAKELESIITNTNNAVSLLKGEEIEGSKTDNPDAPTGGQTSPSEVEIAAQAARAEELAEQRQEQREKEAERQAKELERHEEKLQASLERLKEIEQQFIEESRLDKLSAEDRKVAELSAKYQAQIDEAIRLEKEGVEEATEQRLALERLKEEAILELQNEQFLARRDAENERLAEQEAEDLEAYLERIERKKELQAEIDEEFNQVTLSQYEIERLALEAHYQQMLLLAEKHGIDTGKIKDTFEKKEKKRKDKVEKDEAEKLKKERLKQANDYAEAYNAIGDVIIGVIGLIDSENKKAAAAAKAIAITQIAVSSALAIVNAVESASDLPFPANLAAIATSVGVVVANIAKAKSILSQKKKGGWHDVVGADDGQTYRAQYIGSQKTGMLPSHPVVLASEAGPEYFVSNHDLQNPVVLNHVRAIENLRGTRQFVDGGATAPLPEQASQNNEEVSQIAIATLNVLQQLSNQLANLHARIDDDTVIGVNRRFNEIQSAAGGIIN